MNIYQKLNEARVKLQAMNIKKSGQNRFAGYSYMELKDFLPHVNTLFHEIGLCSVISFGIEMAELTIYDNDKPESSIKFTSPMSSATLKGCHDIQNVGACETYNRRYLYMSALEIVENDALDASQGKDERHVVKDKITIDYAEIFAEAQTMEELSSAWANTPKEKQQQFTAAKDAAKARIIKGQ